MSLNPKALDFFLISFLPRNKNKPKTALIKHIPTPKYKIPWDSVKNVSGILSKWDVMSQLAPHMDNVVPINAITKIIK